MAVSETRLKMLRVTRYPRPSPRLQKQQAPAETLQVALAARLAGSARDTAVSSCPLCWDVL